MPKMKNKDQLNPGQKAFCHKLIELDWNQTQAAIAAGYAKRSAHVTASRLLKNAKVVAYLDECVDKSLGAMKSQIRHKVLSELIPIATADITEVVNVVTKTYEKPILDSEGKPTGETETKEFQTVEIADTKDLKQSRLISSIKQDSKGAIEIKFHDKKSALELLGKHGGLWTDKVELSGKLETENVTMNVNTSNMSDEDAKKLFFEMINKD